jgi:diacylglycerol kinase (ATP)
MKLKVAIIVNGIRKLNPQASETLQLIQNEASIDSRIYTTTKAKEAIRLAQTAADKDFHYILALGGDGTCHEVINGILLSEKKDQIIFGIIPNGTGNDFQKMLGDFQPSSFLKKILKKELNCIDIIQIKNEDHTSYALNIAGTGFDGHVVNTLGAFRKNIRLKGKFAYALAILKSFVTFRKQEIRIKSNEFNYAGKMLMMVVCNGKVFGHGLTINPYASLNDGKLSVTFLGRVSFLDYIRNLGKLKRGELIKHPEVRYFETENLSIQMDEKVIYTEADGELIGSGSFEFSVVKGMLCIVS